MERGTPKWDVNPQESNGETTSGGEETEGWKCRAVIDWKGLLMGDDEAPLGVQGMVEPLQLTSSSGFLQMAQR